jgi:glycosyltransferase involved in cell wall biosynthesis
MPYQFGFVMDQIAGHITNYRNLRSVARHEPDIEATWHEINYYKADGFLERRLSFLPTYVSGVTRATLETHRALRGRSYDAIMSNAKISVFFTHIFRRTPTLLDFDSTPLQIDRMASYGLSTDPRPVARLKFHLARRLFESAALLHAWSRWARQSMIEEYGIHPSKVVVNPPGVDLEFWQPPAQPRGEAGERPRRVLFVGGDFRRKGGPQLLDWYRQQDPARFELHIVTREPVERVPGVYVYHNMQPNTPQLLTLYHTSDLFVLPSLGECFGIATVEAMAAGLPVIASDVGGTADIIQPGRNGLIVPSDDVRALEAAISAILDDDNRRDAMGRQSRLLAEECFDLQRNARKTLGYLKQIADRRHMVEQVAGAGSSS